MTTQRPAPSVVARVSAHPITAFEEQHMPDTNPQAAVEERVARHLAAKEWLTTEDGWRTATAQFRADYLAHAREVIALVQAAPAAAPSALRDRIAAALYERERPPRDPAWADAYAMDREVFEPMADAVLAVLPEPADRAAVLDDEASLIVLHCPDHGPQDQDGAWMDCHCPVAEDMCKRAAELRRVDGEAQQPETGAPTPFTPPAHYRRDDGVDCCVHTIPIGPDSCPHCRELHDDEQPAAVSQPDGEATP